MHLAVSCSDYISPAQQSRVPIPVNPLKSSLQAPPSIETCMKTQVESLTPICVCVYETMCVCVKCVYIHA